MWIFNSSILDGFLSSLGCASKEKVGRLLRGRDCENHLVDNRFERFCYCRYHGCNHKSTYYSGADSHYNNAAWVVAVFVWGYLIMWRSKFTLGEGRTIHKLCAGPCSYFVNQLQILWRTMYKFVKDQVQTLWRKDHVQILCRTIEDQFKVCEGRTMYKPYRDHVQMLWRQDNVQTL